MQHGFSEFTEVELTHPVVVEGHTVPRGARGVVMAAYEDGLAYEVEFEAPVHVVLTLEHDAIRALTHAFV
jgi:hypothetical protein